MNAVTAGLDTNPFHPDGEPSKFVTYRSQREAAAFLQQVYSDENGLGVLHGPCLAGKTSLLRHFVEQLPSDSAAAIIDGADMDTTSLLTGILEQFGYELDWPSINELMNMVRVLAVQFTSVGHAPLLIIENFHAMNPNTIHIVCQLAKLKVHQQSALRIVLVSDRSISTMIGAPALSVIAGRKTGEHELGAMTCAETAYYLDVKLRSGGVEHPEMILPSSVCDELFAETGGRPGLIDQCVLQRLEEADELPLVPRRPLPEEALAPDELTLLKILGSETGTTDQGAMPKLTVTIHGTTLGTFELDGPRCLIGRSSYNDITIDSHYLSRHHALVIRENGITVLVDLNSTNGTYVNSERVLHHVLRHDDIISLGNHGIKLFDPACRDRVEIDNPSLDDTGQMKALRDVRRIQTRERMRVKNRA